MKVEGNDCLFRELLVVSQILPVSTILSKENIAENMNTNGGRKGLKVKNWVSSVEVVVLLRDKWELPVNADWIKDLSIRAYL